MVSPPSSSSLTPDQTPSLSRRSSRNKSNLTLNLSDLPQLIQPSPPSNTLLITNLDNLRIFEPHNLQSIRETIEQHVSIHSFSPLRSFRRIIVSFYEIDAAIQIKQNLDGGVIFGCRVRIYFGAKTDIAPVNQHLEAPKVDKLFFISPPPSPPHDWEIRNEDPPNKQVHPEDLATALSKLHASSSEDNAKVNDSPSSATGRLRSSSITVVYNPEEHGSHPSLPAISVEDTEFFESPNAGNSPLDIDAKANILHTSRPPVELMEQ